MSPVQHTSVGSIVLSHRHSRPQGYIPIAFVANFPGVARFGVELADITAGILASDTLQVCNNCCCCRLSPFCFSANPFKGKHKAASPVMSLRPI